ncbi:uncharacterized protein MKK02DRAFT_35252 [Dioszegia hungarica]|uniref:Uncharacterized protein n=1 Tax=Dioszegia hungarica TaxID=4972 RepID=A0AA38H5X6_9TREE|nr:uncharacterized protein MKK02DRAFT_35252 [Dioszegia hungarica]KAI9633054.1 hypothetical protein MKK02DRAFT_35252 [Dioszegia hungarica]
MAPVLAPEKHGELSAREASGTARHAEDSQLRRRHSPDHSYKRHDSRADDGLATRKKSKHSHRSRERSEDEEELLDLEKLGVEPITEEDHFLRSSEYRYWLKKERGRFLDELTSDDAHKYFRRFVRRWNDGALQERYYYPPRETASTRHQWSFSSKVASKSGPSSAYPQDEEHPRIRRPSSPLPGPPAPNLGSDSDEIGPSLPSTIPSTTTSRPRTTADRQLEREDAHLARQAERKADRLQRYQRANEAVPRSSGKEGKMEEKRATNASNKEMRDKDSTGAGLEVDEGTLMGDQGGFAAALRARDGAKNRKEEERAAMLEDRRAAEQDRLAERRQKETDTMAMFRAMAKERFG